MSLLELFGHVDDFCQQTESQWNSQYSSFKAYYT
jgi:hypothetical protein